MKVYSRLQQAVLVAPSLLNALQCMAAHIPNNKGISTDSADSVISTSREINLGGERSSSTILSEDDENLKRKIALLNDQEYCMKKDFSVLSFDMMSISKSLRDGSDKKIRKHSAELEANQNFIRFQTQQKIFELRRKIKKLKNQEKLVENYIPDYKVFPNFQTQHGKFDPLFLDGEMLAIDDSIVKAMIENLREAFDDLNSLRHMKYDIEIRNSAFSLKELILHQIEYMYKYNLISYFHVRYFMRMENSSNFKL
ncbi:hypothetical protein PGT21_003668 [Puccinia graminis f. sp. tritici]|uniref:Uncharacterized protein n=2 Tax=Puccinia graminis f. sp. tritici TaxID=56615 RepID=A0A5B0LLH4_PUCGR|nr:hypothetical protein PGT21_003668 [Puccinia graminis f. sp. tritici]